MSPAATPDQPSVQALLDEVHIERQALLQHFQDLDGKAGIVLGFAGVLVALAPGEATTLAVVGRVLAAAAGLAALLGFWPRTYPVVHLRTLRDRYLQRGAEHTKLVLLDTQVVIVERSQNLLARKATRLKIAMILLAAAVVSLAGATLLRMS
ncbi:MAG: hypothetical protein ACRDH5_13355 [bacterium]